MIGDVNLFLFPSSPSLADEADPASSENDAVEPNGHGLERLVIGEIEIMIAEKALQGKGYGRASLLVFLKYISRHMDDIMAEYASYARHGSSESAKNTMTTSASDATSPAMGIPTTRLKYLRAKIDMGNTRSISLFEKVGFEKVDDGKPNYFGEIELRLDVSRWRSPADWLIKDDPCLEYEEVECWSRGELLPEFL